MSRFKAGVWEIREQLSFRICAQATSSNGTGFPSYNKPTFPKTKVLFVWHFLFCSRKREPSWPKTLLMRSCLPSCHVPLRQHRILYTCVTVLFSQVWAQFPEMKAISYKIWRRDMRTSSRGLSVHKYHCCISFQWRGLWKRAALLEGFLSLRDGGKV